jgi:hypothetical protein
LNKKIIFGKVENGQKQGQSKSTNLFDGDEDDEDDVEQRFEAKVSQEKGGKSSEKLIELQSRFAHDSRFKIDRKFVDDIHEEEEAPEETERRREKDKNLGILEQVLGKAVAKNPEKPHVEEQLLVPRFDPLDENRDHFLMRMKPQPKVGMKQKEDETKKKKEKPEKPPQVVSQVSKERFYEVAPNLKEAFESREDEPSSFSLSRMFGRTTAEDEGEEEEGGAGDGESRGIPTFEKPVKSHSNPFKYDSSSSDDDEGTASQFMSTATGKRANGVNIKGQDKEEGKRLENLFFKGKFFFTENDPRFKEDLFYDPNLVSKAKEGITARKQVILKDMARRKRFVKRKAQTEERKRKFHFRHKKSIGKFRGQPKKNTMKVTPLNSEPKTHDFPS